MSMQSTCQTTMEEVRIYRCSLLHLQCTNCCFGYLARNHHFITPNTTPSSSSRPRLLTSTSDQLMSHFGPRLHGKQKHALLDRPKSKKIEIQWTHVRMYGQCIHRRGTINKQQMERKLARLGKKRFLLHLYVAYIHATNPLSYVYTV